MYVNTRTIYIYIIMNGNNLCLCLLWSIGSGIDVLYLTKRFRVIFLEHAGVGVS